MTMSLRANDLEFKTRATTVRGISQGARLGASSSGYVMVRLDRLTRVGSSPHVEASNPSRGRNLACCTDNCKLCKFVLPRNISTNVGNNWSSPIPGSRSEIVNAKCFREGRRPCSALFSEDDGEQPREQSMASDSSWGQPRSVWVKSRTSVKWRLRFRCVKF